MQELYDYILDTPLEVLQEHCHLIAELGSVLTHAETSNALHFATVTAKQALAMRLKSPNEIRADASQLHKSSFSAERPTGRTSETCMESLAEADSLMACLESATDHAGCLRALEDLHRLISTPRGAHAAAKAEWLGDI